MSTRRDVLAALLALLMETTASAQPKPSWTPAPKALPFNPGETQVRRAAPVGPLDRRGEAPAVELPPPEHVDLASDPMDL